jgi:hypothetical protein
MNGLGSQRQQGIVLVSAITFLAVAAALVAVALLVGTAQRRLSSDSVHTTSAQFIAEAGISQAIYENYNKLIEPLTTANRNADQYKLKLQTAGFTNGTTKTYTGSLNGGEYSAAITRQDQAGQVQFKVKSKGTLPGGSARVIEQDFFVNTGLFKGFEYALLSNNVNCIFCHAKVTTMEAAYGTINGSKRVKVGTLESLQIRDTSADTLIGGSLYTRGSFENKTGTAITNPSGVDVKTYAVSTTDPNAGTVSNTVTNLNAQDCSLSNSCQANNNFYKNYPLGEGLDGELPDKFPTPVADTNGNKKIDDGEWTAAISNELSPGTLSGGSIKQVGKTSPFTQVTASSLNTNSSASGIGSNLILDGTTTPIEINGTVYVDGDVVIKGKIKGNGKIVARGNVYVVGDIEYDCNGPCSYANPGTLPKFGLVAGGNMMVGDYVSPTKSTATQLLNSATLAPATGDISFSMSEMYGFNKRERNKALADPTYVPRFYRRGPAETRVLYYNGTGERAAKYATDVTEIDAALLARGTVVDLAPNNGWLSESQVKQMWIDTIETPARATSSFNTALKKPLQIDALLYSSNAIFTLARKLSKVNGQMTLNGSLIAADTGVLVPGPETGDVTTNNASSTPGLRIHYDQRLSDLVKLRGSSKLVITQSNYRLVKNQ